MNNITNNKGWEFNALKSHKNALKIQNLYTNLRKCIKNLFFGDLKNTKTFK